MTWSPCLFLKQPADQIDHLPIQNEASVYSTRTTLLLADFVSPEFAGNVYGVVPVNAARDVSIILMVIHQFVAYALYVTPVFFMW